MALVTIREYADVAVTFGKIAQCVAESGAEADQSVTTSGTSAQSAAFGANTQLIAVSTPPSQAVAYVVGASPTAVVTSLRLPSNCLIYLGVKPGHKIAFIDVA